jgi:hypothetical protein
MVQKVLGVYERVLEETPSSGTARHSLEDDQGWEALFNFPAATQP